MTVKTACARALVLVLGTVGLFAAIPSGVQPAAAASNPVVIENQQAGSQGWKLGSLVSDDVNGQIQGYASASSVLQGGSLTLYVTVNPAQTYTIDFYRIGWYNGNGGRLRLHAGPFNGAAQPACPVDATTGLIACNWAPAYSLSIPSDWTSGIYLAKLTNAAGYQNYVIFIVRDNRPAAFLYQSPLNTAEAYNNYPNDGKTGKSLYDYNSFGANTIVGSKRAVKVSFDRPFSGNAGSGIFLSYEIQFVRWAEHAGYDLTYSADVDTHENGSALLNHRAFISAGHDEYWSNQMYTAAQNARDAGVNLAFLGANPIYYQLRYEASATGAPDRVMVCYKNASIDPVQGPTVTVNWRDPALNRPEQSLIGIQYTSESGPGKNVAYVVTNSSSWVYAGTGFHDGDTVAGIVGYEEDRLMSNYPSAPSLSYTLLSQSPFTDTSGIADYANSSIYQAPSGAWVFATGTMSWGWALDSYYNSGTPTDPRIQQTTANVLNAFVSGPPILHDLKITAPAGSTAGQGFTLSVTAENAQGTPVTGYTGTVHFTSTDGSATLPPDYTFTTADAGVHQFSTTLQTAGRQRITVVDTVNPSLTGAQAVTVSSAPAATLTLSGLTGDMAGTAQTATVAFSDPYGNPATGYRGTVHFSSSDGQAGLPADYTYTAADAGSHQFPLTLNTAGSQTVTVGDVSNGALTATQTLAITPAAAVTLTLSGLGNGTAGDVQTATVSARSSNGAVATAYTGTIHFSSSDDQASLPADYTFTSADGGVHQFAVTIKTAGNQNVSVTDTSNSALNGSQTMTVTPAAAARLSVGGLSNAIAGSAQTATVALYDPFGNTATGYTGTVHFSSTDAQATLPGDYTFSSADAGSHQFSLRLNSSGTQTVTVTDSLSGSLSNSQTVTISAASASTLSISGLSGSTAGTSQTARLTVYAADGSVATGYTGTVHFTSTDSQAGLPADYTFASADAGVHQFTVTLKTAGIQTVTVTDAAIASLTGSQSVSVGPAPAAAINVSGLANTVAGAAQSAQVTALDPFGNVAAGYAGTVHLSSSDPQAVLPADYSFTTADAGSHQLSVILKTAGLQTIAATDTVDASLSGGQRIVISPASASTLTMTGLSNAVAGTGQTAALILYDPYGNVATTYAGTVRFSSSDAQATLPPTYTFTSTDAGAHRFSVTLKTAGSQSVSVIDSANPSIAGSQLVSISPAAAASMKLSGLSDAVAGTGQTTTATLKDAFGNVATGYGGTIHFSSSDAQASLPADYQFTSNDAGSHQFSLTLKTAGSKAVTATDTTTGTVTGSQTVTISPAAASTLTMSGLINAIAGTVQPARVALSDPYGNTATGYTGTVHFTSSDNQATLPANYAFTPADAGTHQFTVVLKTAGGQGVTAADTANASLASSQSVTINPAAASTLTLSGLSNAVAGTGQTARVALSDPYGNVATGYSGAVHFNSNDGQATLPADYKFTSGDAGVHQFSLTLKTAGSRTVTASDTTNSALTGSQAVQVTPGSASKLTIVAPSTAKANQSFSLTVTLTDQFGNVATGYAGTVHFSSSDTLAQTLGDLPADYRFTSADAGRHTFTATLVTVGNQTITVADTINAALNATSAAIAISVL
jgi:hypothetical protein